MKMEKCLCKSKDIQRKIFDFIIFVLFHKENGVTSNSLRSALLSSLFHLSVTVEMLGIISLRYFLLSSMGCKTVKLFQEAMSHHSEMKWKISSKCVLFLE